MKIRLTANKKDFNKLLSACREYLKTEFPPNSNFNLLYLSVEEAFINITSYAYDGQDGYVDFEIITLDENRVKVIFTDGGKPFNPVEFKSEINAKNNIDNFIPGGLGIDLIKKTMKNLQYKYINEKNIFSYEAILEKDKWK